MSALPATIARPAASGPRGVLERVMAERARRRAEAAPMLRIRGLHVYYGQSHALQGVDLDLPQGVVSVVGRNGMGKTTLCNAIIGLVTIARGSVQLEGEELAGAGPSRIAHHGVGYVPQGRRLWPSLTVDEHLRLCERGVRRGGWTRDRIYEAFPRLADRRTSRGGQLSGGEQQMLAISRALLLNPRLLVMDEPTEGLAPVIVQQVEDMLIRIGEEAEISVLVIEQNIGVATAVSEDVANHGERAHQPDHGRRRAQRRPGAPAAPSRSRSPRRGGSASRELPTRRAGVGHGAPGVGPRRGPGLDVEPAPADALVEAGSGRGLRSGREAALARTPYRRAERESRIAEITPLSAEGEPVVLVIGTFDTKGPELKFIRDRLAGAGQRAKLVDVSTSGRPSAADVPPHQVAAYHPKGPNAVFTRDRGASVREMAVALERWMPRQAGVAGVISAGGSGGTALAAPAMQTLPVGVPKVMISTVASGDVGRYVGPSDIMMMYSVTDVQGLNAISRKVLANGAHALAGMVARRGEATSVRARARARVATAERPAVGITMFGVTTPCVQRLSAKLEGRFECLIFHATGVGGRSMEKLLDSGQLAGLLDVTTTEICDMMMGGVFAADEDRFGAAIRTRAPYVGSCGALDMVNFGARDTVPERYRGRMLHEHNPQVTLMRTTPEENARMGRWIGERLNRMDGPVRFFLPEGGVSALDAPGQPFHDPAADTALFEALEQTVRQTGTRQLVRLPFHINDPAFSDALAAAFEALAGARTSRARRSRRYGR